MPVKGPTKSSTARKSEAYVDTSALIAFTDSSDSHRTLLRRRFGDPPAPDYNLIGGSGRTRLVLKRYDIPKGLQFLSMVKSMPLEIVPVRLAEQNAAIEIIRRYPDQDLTLTDAAGLHLMGCSPGVPRSRWATPR